MPSANPLAILIADIHLSHKRPIARSGETDWYAAMKRPLDQLNKLAGDFNVPILCAGDVFDKWNAPAELINFALEHLPHMYGIPGQHDLPFHSIEDIKRSALFNLVLHDKFRLLKEPTKFGFRQPLVVHPFQWKEKLAPRKKDKEDAAIHIALAHKYIWKSKKNSYPGAPEVNHYRTIQRQLRDFDVAAFGDNHIGFTSKPDNNGLSILNCGAFMRRAIDQVDYQPTVGILWDNKKITREKLDCSQDVMLKSSTEEIKALEEEFGMEGFVDELLALGSDALNFNTSVRHFLDRHNIQDRVRKFVMEALDSKDR